MVPSVPSLLVGPARNRSPTSLHLFSAVLVFAITLSAYALGVFEVSGGVVFLAADAAIVGAVAAAILGYQRAGLLFAWLVAYGSLLGYSADHYFLGLSGRSVLERAIAFLGVDGLVFFAIQALVLGTLAWSAGGLAGLVVRTVREGMDESL